MTDKGTHYGEENGGRMMCVSEQVIEHARGTIIVSLSGGYEQFSLAGVNT
jgi:hypothetical protein